jgi:hypothetical protein
MTMRFRSSDSSGEILLGSLLVALPDRIHDTAIVGEVFFAELQDDFQGHVLGA